jgi:molybdopterin-guanine dinucleotide biosynthesis protein
MGLYHPSLHPMWSPKDPWPLMHAALQRAPLLDYGYLSAALHHQHQHPQQQKGENDRCHTHAHAHADVAVMSTDSGAAVMMRAAVALSMLSALLEYT